MLRAARSSFQNKIGWNANMCVGPFCDYTLHDLISFVISKRVFEILGFTEEVHENDLALKPPVTDTVSPQGKLNRKKLLRAWVEIGAWVTDYRRKHCE